MSKKVTYIIIIVLVVVLVVLFQQESSDEPIVIGAIFPVTGTLARYGELELNGLLMAQEEINSAGGIDGRRLEFIVEDSTGSTHDAVSAWNRIKREADVPLVFATISSICQALSPISNEQETVLLASDCAGAAYSSPDDFTFRVLTSNAVEGSRMASYLLDEGIDKIAVMQINNAYGQGLYEGFFDYYEKNGGSVEFHTTYTRDNTDFRTELSKIKGTDSKAIYLMSYSQDAAVILKQLVEVGLDLPRYAAQPVENASVMATVPQYAEGVLYPRPHFDLGGEFAKNYKKRFGQTAEVTAARTYDSVYILRELLEQCGDSDCMKSLLYEMNYNGVMGHYDWDDNGDVLIPFVLKEITGGSFRVAGKPRW